MSPEDRSEKKEEEKEEPAEPALGPVAALFHEAIPEIAFEAEQGARDVLLSVSRENIHALLEKARKDERLSFDFLSNLSGVDYEADGLEVVYHLYSYKHGHSVTVRTPVPLDDPQIATASDIWNAADWHEREARDMFGINFQGHPNLVPILLPEDMLDHFPLRKEIPLAPLEEWQGEMLGPDVGKAGYIPPGSGIVAEASKEDE